MDQKQLLNQMIDFYQTSFDNVYNANVMLLDQLESVTNTLLDQASWFPPEGRQALEKWTEAYKTGRETFKKTMDESYKKLKS